MDCVNRASNSSSSAKRLIRRRPSASDNSNDGEESRSQSHLWRTLRTNHATMVDNLIQLLKTEIVWKKRSPLSNLANISHTFSQNSSLDLNPSELKGSQGQGVQAKSPARNNFASIVQFEEDEEEDDKIPLARSDSEAKPKKTNKTAQTSKIQQSEKLSLTVKEGTEQLCVHEEKQSAECCPACIERRYKPSRMLIDNIADSVERHLLTEEVSSRQGEPETSNTFDGVLPTISLNDYLFRCVRYMDKWFHDSPGIKSSGMQSLLCSLIYVHRIRETIPEFKLTKYNVHRLFMVSMLLSAKFMQDKPITNRFWSKVGGIEVSTLNKFETLFCTSTGFNLFVTDQELDILYEEFA